MLAHRAFQRGLSLSLAEAMNFQ
ncbi:hypothetical protein A2U01_0090687, partial [Trifolium medium]|nr:hypothetical protein [Trifolium medium]